MSLMKTLNTILSFLAIGSLLIIFSCGGNVSPSLSLQQKAAKIMDEGSAWGGSGNVEVISTPSGVDPTQLLNLQITFNTSGPDDWAPTFITASGADDFFSTDRSTWVWAGSGTDVISLTEASTSELTSVEVNETSVRFTFVVDSSTGGRTTGIDGNYTVLLK